MNRIDRLICGLDRALKVVVASPVSDASLTEFAANSPQSTVPLDDAERHQSAALMRVNHVGEVCAQALYLSQASATANPALRDTFREAAAEEQVHLRWTAARIRELGGRTSLLNPLWYGGAFVLGYLAGKSGDAISLGFVVETELQVEQHLQGHLTRLPVADQRSRAIVTRMRDDEARHGRAAQSLGAQELPVAIKQAMHWAAKLMTSTAYHI